MGTLRIGNNLVSPSVFTSGGTGTSDHTQLTNRDAADQHPVSSITGLQSALNGKLAETDFQTFTWEQATPSNTWNITHSVKRIRPSVTVVDSLNRVVLGQVDYVDDTHITVSFSAAFAGKAFIN